jgi:hypothetical protein
MDMNEMTLFHHSTAKNCVRQVNGVKTEYMLTHVVLLFHVALRECVWNVCENWMEKIIGMKKSCKLVSTFYDVNLY